MRLLALCLAATLALGACARNSKHSSAGKVDGEADKGENWRGDFKGMASHSSIVGHLKANVLDGKTSASVTIDGASNGEKFPWMIHHGSCSMPGNPVGLDEDYPVIAIGPDGKGHATANLKLALDEQNDYAVIVHASRADMATHVACGALDD